VNTNLHRASPRITDIIKLSDLEIPELYTRPPKSPGGGLKRHFFKKNNVKINKFCDIVLKSPSGGFRGLSPDDMYPHKDVGTYQTPGMRFTLFNLN
jgi:hypothetical protein